MTTHIAIKCLCGKHYSVNRQHAGKTLRCKSCNQTIPITEMVTPPELATKQQIEEKRVQPVLTPDLKMRERSPQEHMSVSATAIERCSHVIGLALFTYGFFASFGITFKLMLRIGMEFFADSWFGICLFFLILSVHVGCFYAVSRLIQEVGGLLADLYRWLARQEQTQ